MTHKSSIQTIAALLFFTASLSVSAGCLQSDLAGSWTLIGTGHNVYYGNTDQSIRCKVVVKTAGGLNTSKSSCDYRDATGRGSSDINGGSLRTNSACNLSGRLYVCNSSSCGYYKLDYGKLSRDKQSLIGAAYLESNPDYIVNFQGLKN